METGEKIRRRRGTVRNIALIVLVLGVAFGGWSFYLMSIYNSEPTPPYALPIFVGSCVGVIGGILVLTRATLIRGPWRSELMNP